MGAPESVHEDDRRSPAPEVSIRDRTVEIDCSQLHGSIYNTSMPQTSNPLISDQDCDFLLYDVLGVERLLELDAFSEHSRETFDLLLKSARRMARTVLYPAYKP